jgi:hypothetical protein
MLMDRLNSARSSRRAFGTSPTPTINSTCSPGRTDRPRKLHTDFVRAAFRISTSNPAVPSRCARSRRTHTPRRSHRDGRVRSQRAGRGVPDGAIAKSFPLKGSPQTEICENPAKHLVGKPGVVEVEKEILDGNLEPTTETRERNRLAVLSCGVHKERAIECFEAHRPDDGAGMPRVAPLVQTEGA